MYDIDAILNVILKGDALEVLKKILDESIEYYLIYTIHNGEITNNG